MQERFTDTWKPIRDYRWQKDRAVVGHNLKIAWNLTRVAFYHQTRAWRAENGGQGDEVKDHRDRAERCLALARKIGDRMGDVGLDKVRGGVFDCVERQPSSGMPVQFAWEPTKDFWQQEQGILAYLILHGAVARDPSMADLDKRFVQLARECSAYWNTFFLDRERQGYFFRVTADGLPIIEGEYGRKSGHAIGYHVFELAYLAHTYTRLFFNSAGGGAGGADNFCLYFRVRSSEDQTSLNVLPDFLPPGSVTVIKVWANGVDVTESRRPRNPNDFQISLRDLKGSGRDNSIQLAVEFAARGKTGAR